MLDTNNFWTDPNRCTPATSFYGNVMNEIQVFLVDHAQDLMNTAQALDLCQYKVTLARHASKAMITLTSGNLKFDVVMANIHDTHVWDLVQQALNMGIPIIFVSSHDNASMAKKAIDIGAFLYLVKPVSMEFMRSLWQHVLREKARMMRQRKMLVAANRAMTQNIGYIVHNPMTNSNLMVMEGANEKNKGKGVRKGATPEGYYLPEGTPMRMGASKLRRKMCMEWTPELHAIFMDAIHLLGDGGCFPKEIQQLMCIPGLTRGQVASHLQAFRQKCRNNNWQSPKVKKSVSQGGLNASTNNEGSCCLRSRRFGVLPKMVKDPLCPGHEATNHAETSDAPTNINPRIENTSETGNLMNDGGGAAAIHHQCVTILPLPVTSPSLINPRQEELFTDIDHLLYDFPYLLQESIVGPGNSVPASSSYPYDNLYSDQNISVPSLETEPLNFLNSNFEARENSEDCGRDV